jgi:RNA polymerase sigma-70 factor (ECF subfamily)
MARARHISEGVIETADVAVSALRSASTRDREEAWRALYDDHFERLHRLVYRFGVPEADVEDVTQRAFLVAHRRMTEVDRVDNVGAWLRGIAVRVVSDYHRWRRVRWVKRWLLHSTADAATPRPVSPEREAASSELQRRVGAVVAELSPKLREVLVLVEIEELTVDEAAAVLQLPVNTVRSRRRLARAAFARLWTRRMSPGASAEGDGHA